MKQLRNQRGNQGGELKFSADHRLAVIHDQRLRLWAARSMAFP